MLENLYTLLNQLSKNIAINLFVDNSAIHRHAFTIEIPSNFGKHTSIHLENILPNIFYIASHRNYATRIYLNWNIIRYYYEIMNPTGKFMDCFGKILDNISEEEHILFLIEEMDNFSDEKIEN